MGSVSWTLRLGPPPRGGDFTLLDIADGAVELSLFWGKVALVWRRWHGAWATQAAAPCASDCMSCL